MKWTAGELINPMELCFCTKQTNKVRLMRHPSPDIGLPACHQNQSASTVFCACSNQGSYESNPAALWVSV
eukprot:7987738-Pyramimonas_sp.AAC.1